MLLASTKKYYKDFYSNAEDIYLLVFNRAARYSKINLGIALYCLNIQDNIDRILVYSFQYNIKIVVSRM